MTVLIHISYYTSSSSSPYNKHFKETTLELAHKRIQEELNTISRSSTPRDIKVYLGEVTEEYEATPIWDLKPVGNTVSKPKVNTTSKGGVEI